MVEVSEIAQEQDEPLSLGERRDEAPQFIIRSRWLVTLFIRIGSRTRFAALPSKRILGGVRYARPNPSLQGAVSAELRLIANGTNEPVLNRIPGLLVVTTTQHRAGEAAKVDETGAIEPLDLDEQI